MKNLEMSNVACVSGGNPVAVGVALGVAANAFFDALTGSGCGPRTDISGAQIGDIVGA